MITRLIASLGVLFVAATLVRGGPSTNEPAGKPDYDAWREHFATYSVAKETKPLGGASRRLQCSPDGTLLLAVGPADKAVLIDASTLELRFALVHPKQVNDAVFSPDGKLVLTACDDNTARLWDAASGQEVRSLAGHTKEVMSCVFSPDGAQCATGGMDCMVRFWNVADGKALSSVKNTEPGFDDENKQPPGGILSLAWSPDGSRLTAGGSAGERLNIVPGKKSTASGSTYYGGRPRFVRVSYTANNSHLLFLSLEPASKWRTCSLEAMGFGVGTNSAGIEVSDKVADFALEPSGRFVATIAPAAVELVELDIKPPQQEKEYWMRDTLKPFVSLKLNDRQFCAATFGPHGAFFTTTSDGSVQCWGSKGEAPERLRHPVLLKRSKRDLDRSPRDKCVDEETAADSAFKEWINFYKSIRQAKQSTPRDPQVSSVEFSADGTTFLCANGNRALLLNTATFEVVREFAGHRGRVFDARFSPDGKFVATASADKTARIFDAATGKELNAYSRHEGAVNVVCFSPDGKMLATGGDDSRIGILEASSLKELAVGKFQRHDWETDETIQGKVTHIAWDPESEQLLAAGTEGISITIDTRGRDKTSSWHGDDVSTIFIGHAKDLKVEATDNGRISFTNETWGEGQRNGDIEGPFDVTAMALSRNGKFALLATDTGKLRIYPIRIPVNRKSESGRGYYTTSLGYSSELDLPKGRKIMALAASRDARKIAGVDDKGRIVVWSTDIEPPKDE